jgi:hypothetical protein
MTKKCCSCQLVRDLADFNRSSKRPDGRNTRCRECSAEYMARYRSDSFRPKPKADPAARFWAKVQRGEGCWEWQGANNGKGYGCFGKEGSRPYYAHRFSWELHAGPIPDGLFVLHRCDNRRCVNPEHLFLGTQGDNMRDMIAKGRGRWSRCA